MISECLGDIDQPTELGSFFKIDYPNNLPAYMHCLDKKQDKQNCDITQHNLDSELLGECKEVFNVRNLNDSGLLQAGYAKNIDLDSELKRINHFDDKCFYDNYKNDPRSAEKCTGLEIHKDTLVKDYSTVGKFRYKEVTEPVIAKDKSECNLYPNFMTPGICRNNNPNDRDRFDWDKHKIDTLKCLKKDTFDRCTDVEPALCNSRDELLARLDNMPEYYQFHDTSKCGDYPCQRLFNNFTRRSTLPNFQNVYDINPKFLA